MNTMIGGIFILGLIVGSFLNVVILRYNTGVSLGGRSGCPICGHTLQWYELIPVVSFCIQKGRCRSCSTPISWQYMVVELVTGILFVGVHLKFFSGIIDGSYVLHALYYWVIMSLLVVITIYDIQHKIIPDPFVYALIVLGFGSLVLGSMSSIGLLNVLAAPLAALPFLLLWGISKGAWMGFGDVKLAFAIGWLLQPLEVVSALILAFWIGALWGVGIIAVQNIWGRGAQSLSMKSEIPFAPFMIVGLLLVFFFQISVFMFV